MVSVATNGRRLCSRYTLVEKLGAGGQGEVWLARDDTRGGNVALKVLSSALAHSESAWAALEHEHQIASRLDHPSILRSYPPQRDGDAAVLPMELAAGGDLRRLRGMSYLEVVPVLLEVAHALEHAHERGVVHRDLKPSNVLFDADGRAKLADFGVAAGMARGSTRDRVRPGVSPFTASPQHLRGEPPAASDDIYGLGALAYELLSGYPPFYPHFDLKRVLEEPVAPLKPVHHAPARLTALVMRMLAKRPDQRPRSMREVIDELDATLNDTLTYEGDELIEPQTLELPAAQRAPAMVAQATTAHRPAVPVPANRAQSHEVDSPSTATAQSERPSDPPRIASSSRAARTEPADRKAPPAHPEWDELRIEAVPSLMRIEPERASRWPWVVLALLVAGAAGVFYVLPRFAPGGLAIPGVAIPNVARVLPVVPPSESPSAPSASTPASNATSSDEQSAARLQQTRAAFEQQVAALEGRGAGVWGGREFAAARARAAEAVGAFDAGDARLSEERLTEAVRLLESVEGRAPQALSAQLAAGDRALDDGDAAAARQAFEFAQRIEPGNTRAADGLRRAQRLSGVLPLLADGANAEAEKDYSRAVQDYSQALSLDPKNAKARAGLQRANAALGADAYAKAVGKGFAALGAGRLEEARRAFEQAREIRPSGREATAGIGRVEAAMRARTFASIRARAARLESEERWSEALREYESALEADSSLSFAQAGRTRAAARAALAERLQALIDDPQRLASAAVRTEAADLVRSAQSQDPSGPVLRSQIARLQILLPEFDKPVRLALVSDNSTQVAIPRIGSFGTFSRREIELKPGKYTVIGTRVGYRDVRRDVTVAPGQQVQTISIRCVEPI